MKLNFLIIFFLVLTHFITNAQGDEQPFALSAYLETYYIYDVGNPSNHRRPDFIFSHDRHNEVNINLGMLKASYTKERVRANLALMAGTYANANLAHEPGVLRNILEANVGVRVLADKYLWVTAGVFDSHLGFEGAIGADCRTMTRSLAAEGAPYYLSGAKITYRTEDEKWEASGMVLNGWQRIQRLAGNQTPAFGHQLLWQPNNKITLNSSSFIGSDTPDTVRQMRYFHSFYAEYRFSDAFDVIGEFDIGAEQEQKSSSRYDRWHSTTLIARYALHPNWSVAGRLEYYVDGSEVIVETDTPNGFETFGYSINVDYQFTDEVLWRIEGRAFHSKDAVFSLDNTPASKNFFVGTSLSVKI